VRCFEYRVAHGGKIRVTLVVGHDENDVRSILSEERDAGEEGDGSDEVFWDHEN